MLFFYQSLSRDFGLIELLPRLDATTMDLKAVNRMALSSAYIISSLCFLLVEPFVHHHAVEVRLSIPQGSFDNISSLPIFTARRSADLHMDSKTSINHVHDDR
jgi:hypothetical protein